MKWIQSALLFLALLAVGLGVGKRFHEESTDEDSEDGESVFVTVDRPAPFVG